MKSTSSSSSPSENRRCWFLTRTDYFVAEPETVIEALRNHPMVTRVNWSPGAPTTAVHLTGRVVDCFRAHVVLLEALLTRLLPQANNEALVLPLALHDFHPDPKLRTFISLDSIIGMPIYLRVPDHEGSKDHRFVAIHRPNPLTDLIYQVRPDCPNGEWAGLPTETLEAGSPITATEFYQVLQNPRGFADSLRLL